MMPRRLLLPGALLLLLLGLAAWLLIDRLEFREETVELGPSPEARANPYLAAEHFLRQQGLTVSQAENLREIEQPQPAAGHSLLLLGDRSRMTPGQAQRLLEWSARGGHLLFVAQQLWDEARGESGDLLLDRLGLQQFESDAPPHPDGPAGGSGDAAANLARFFPGNDSEPAYLAFDTDFHLYDPQQQAHAWANSESATHLLQLRHGQGRVTVLTDSWLWENDRIAEHDHAWLLWHLTRGTQVTLVHHSDRPGLASQLLRHFPEALCALALLLGLGLWRASLRRGPLLDSPSLARRQLQAHLRGAAEFLLRHGGQSRLLGLLQRDVQRRARQRHPGLELLPPEGQRQVLARLTRLTQEEIGEAMRPLSERERLGSVDFTRQVARLQTLRNAL